MISILQSAWFLLSPPERRAFLFALAMMLFGMGFELLGVGIILPVLTLLTGDGSSTSSFPLLNSLRESLPGHRLAIAVAAGLVVLFGVKNLFLAYQAWIQQRFVFNVQRYLSYRLLEKYLNLPYAFHLRRNSAQLIRNTVNEVAQYVYNVINPLMLILTEIIVSSGLVVLLLALEPAGTAAIATLLGTVGTAYYLATHRRSTRLGAARVYHEGQRIQLIQQSLGGIKEIKLINAEANCLSDYDLNNRLAARAARNGSVLVQLPRLVLEVAGVSAVAVLLCMMSLQDRDFSSSLPLLGVMAAAAIRLIPSANRMMTSLNMLRYGLPVLKVLGDELRIPEPPADPSAKAGDSQAGPVPFSHTIEAAGLGFTYESAARSAIAQVSFQIEKNTSVGIIGKSGSGKSTLVDLLLGLLEPETGRLLVDGRDIRENLRAWQDQIGYVPQSIYLTDDSIRKNVAFGIPNDAIDNERVRQALQAAHLFELVEDLPEGLDTLVGERGVRLSGGQRQRIGIARALYRDPAVLVFDEATSALDHESEERVMDAIRDLKGSRTIVIVAHRLSTVAHCDHLIRLDNGKVIQAGPSAEVLASPASV